MEVEKVEFDETRVIHCCESCGTILAVHRHANYQAVKGLPSHDARAVRRLRQLARMPFRAKRRTLGSGHLLAIRRGSRGYTAAGSAIENAGRRFQSREHEGVAGVVDHFSG